MSAIFTNPVTNTQMRRKQADIEQLQAQLLQMQQIVANLVMQGSPAEDAGAADDTAAAAADKEPAK